jgi:GcrA cell cycle regulator
MRADWSDARVELLKKLWAEGLSSRDIACRMGLDSRSAVIGKLHRLGLSDQMRGKVKPPAIPRIPRPKTAPAYRKAQPARASLASPSLPPQPAPVAMIDDEIEIPPHARKGLLDLERGDCRWPIGHPDQAGFGFCGRSAALGISYCQAHAQRAYRMPDPQRATSAPATAPASPSAPVANDNEPRVSRRDLVDA